MGKGSNAKAAPIGAPDNNEEISKLGFVDLLFAVAVDIGITHGFLKLRWVDAWSLPENGEMFKTFSLLLGFTTLVLSWIGYHKSIAQKPVHGSGRFIIDISLVLFYTVLLIKFDDFSAIVQLLAVIYTLYFVWDIFKVVEYSAMYNVDPHRIKRYAREWVSLLWAIVFGAFFVFKIMNVFSNETLIWLCFVGTIVYRLHKGKANS